MLTGDTILKEPKSNVIVTHASCMEIGEEGTNKKRMMMVMITMDHLPEMLKTRFEKPPHM